MGKTQQHTVNKQLVYIEQFFNSEEFIHLAHRAQEGDDVALDLLAELTVCMETAHFFLKQKNKERTDYEIQKMQKIIKEAQ